MSFLARFSRKKVERRASIATISEIPDKSSGWKTKIGSKFEFSKISNFLTKNHNKPGHAKLSRRISERLDGRPSVKISDNYEIDGNDFKAIQSGKVFKIFHLQILFDQ